MLNSHISVINCIEPLPPQKSFVGIYIQYAKAALAQGHDNQPMDLESVHKKNIIIIWQRSVRVVRLMWSSGGEGLLLLRAAFVCMVGICILYALEVVKLECETRDCNLLQCYLSVISRTTRRVNDCVDCGVWIVDCDWSALNRRQLHMSPTQGNHTQIVSLLLQTTNKRVSAEMCNDLGTQVMMTGTGLNSFSLCVSLIQQPGDTL